MAKIVPELNYLLAEVEKRYGRRLSTSADFEALSVVVEHESGELISASTLKRLWGYVTLKPTPRISTLNVLSRYIGKRDFNAFQQSIMSDGHYVSNFFSVKKVCTSDLKKGAEVLIGWAPNRLVTLRYLGTTGTDTTQSSSPRTPNCLKETSFRRNHLLLLSAKS